MSLYLTGTEETPGMVNNTVVLKFHCGTRIEFTAPRDLVRNGGNDINAKWLDEAAKYLGMREWVRNEVPIKVRDLVLENKRQVGEIEQLRKDYSHLRQRLSDTSSALQKDGMLPLSEVPAKAKAVMARLDELAKVIVQQAGGVPAPQPTVEMVGYLSAGGLGWAAFVRGNWGNTENVMDGQFADELARASVTKHTVQVVVPAVPTPTAPTRTLAKVTEEIIDIVGEVSMGMSVPSRLRDLLLERNQLIGK